MKKKQINRQEQQWTSQLITKVNMSVNDMSLLAINQ